MWRAVGGHTQPFAYAVGFCQVKNFTVHLFLHRGMILSSTAVSDKTQSSLFEGLQICWPHISVILWHSLIYSLRQVAFMRMTASHAVSTSIRVTFPFPELKSLHFLFQDVGENCFLSWEERAKWVFFLNLSVQIISMDTCGESWYLWRADDRGQESVRCGSPLEEWP